ncbi:MAG: Ubiquitin-conjugating enzyme E2 B [Marteilia pararefringens]
MSTNSRRRLLSDFNDLVKGQYEGLCAAPRDDNILQWQGYIIGPQNTPFEDGTFKLTMNFSEEYPNKPPVVKFITPMFHPNIYEDGAICLDILTKNWNSTYHISTILLSIQSLLDEPNTDSPANKDAAYFFQNNKVEYRKRVNDSVLKSWVHLD